MIKPKFCTNIYKGASDLYLCDVSMESFDAGVGGVYEGGPDRVQVALGPRPRHTQVPIHLPHQHQHALGNRN